RLFRIIACAAASHFIFDYRHRGLKPRNFFENMNRFIYKVALAFAFPGVCASAFGQNGADVNETAHLLAGMPVTGALTSFTQNSGWQAHAAAMDKAWKTKEYSQLGRGNLGGTLPILYVFLARLGCTVLDTVYVHNPAEGVKITFSHGGGSQTLYYFKTDLSGGDSAFLRWCAARGPGVSLIKAASYLMHGDGFSGVRSFLLEHSSFIVQDDSGIPMRAFS